MGNLRHRWTQEEVDSISSMHKNGMSIKEIADQFGVSIGCIHSVFSNYNLEIEVREKNDYRFKAPYQTYEWCYQRYVNERKTYEEMAEEAGCKPRTIQKWCSEVHRLNQRTISGKIHLSDLQRRLVMFSLLGDGHISETSGNFIVSHTEKQKDYLFWKYEI